MGELRCHLDWTGKTPKLIIEIEAELAEAQVRELARVLAKTAEKKLNCLQCSVERCAERGGADGREGNRPLVH